MGPQGAEDVAQEARESASTSDATEPQDGASTPQPEGGDAGDAVPDERDERDERGGSDAESADADAPAGEVEAEGPFLLASEDVADGGEMPEAFACCTGNPQLSWSGAPSGTLSFALIFDDPDAGDFDHWALYNIPAELSALEAAISGKGIMGELPEGAGELVNGFSFSGYLGPCPPEAHTYRWRLWALSGVLDEPPADFSDLEAQANALSLGQATMTTTFGPKTAAQGATCE